MLLIGVGPAVSMAGYIAIVNRLGEDPVVQVGWVRLMYSTRRSISVLNAYVETYGIDRMVAMTVLGNLATLPALYMATKLLPILSRLLALDRGWF